MSTDLELFANFVNENAKRQKIQVTPIHFCNENCRRVIINNWNENFNEIESIYYIFSIIKLLKEEKIVLKKCSYWYYLKYLKPQISNIKKYVDHCNQKIKELNVLNKRLEEGEAKISVKHKLKSFEEFLKKFNNFLLYCDDTPINYKYEPNVYSLLDIMKMLCFIEIERKKKTYQTNFTFDDCFNHLEQQFNLKHKYTVLI